MRRYAKVFKAEESEEASMIELSCLKEALHKNGILCCIVYKCYFDNTSESSCKYLERPNDPNICRQILCSKWLKRLGESLQLGVHLQKGAVIDPDMEADIEVYVSNRDISQVQSEILPAVRAKAVTMKALVKELHLMSTEQIYA